MAPLSIVWFRQDLRVDDQPALLVAAGEGAVVPVYVLDDETPGKWAIGGAQRWWLHNSLAALGQSLERLGSRLILRRGPAMEALGRLAGELGTRRIHVTRHYEPWWREAEDRIGAEFDLVIHEGDVLVSPEQIRTGGGTPYKIYTPYWRASQEQLPPSLPQPGPDKLEAPSSRPASDDLNAWSLLPTDPDWAVHFADEWVPGEATASTRLRHFFSRSEQYSVQRDLPSEEGTTRLSPHLHFGEISPRQIWHLLPEGTGEKFRKELAWRDFSHNVMLSQPTIGERAGRREYAAFPWRTGLEADSDFRAWSLGRTGYPIVDAGMRQLWATGWMHNRVRMISASFLVKHLLIDWRRGADWFWDTLVDADYGNNSQNWQWVAGTGLDSQPFYRIMAPTAQAEKFAAGDYIRRWVPELAKLDDESILNPSGLSIASYPQPIVEHRQARDRALAAHRGFVDAKATSR